MVRKNNVLIGTNLLLVVLFVSMTIFTVSGWNTHGIHMNDMDHMRDDFIMTRGHIQGDLMHQGGYRCCLEKPCTYCIEKTPGHGEGAICDCLSDVMNGVHPCGECIGEILEGHGNRYLAKYFAMAIAEKTGELDAIKRIISDKYGISVEEQV